MGVSPKDIFCKKIESELDVIIRQLDAIAPIVTGFIQTLKSELQILVSKIPTPLNEMNDAQKKIDDSIKGLIPDMSKVDEIQDLMRRCGILKEGFNTKTPAAILNSLTHELDGMVDSVSSLLSDILSAAVEYPTALLLNNLEKLTKNLGLPDIISSIDKYLQCLDTVCGIDIESKLTHINHITDSLYIRSNGTIDIQSLGEEIGNTTEQIFNVQVLQNKLESSANDAADQLADAMPSFTDAVKSYVA